MRIGSISNYNFSNRQNFGARLDNNTKALVRNAKSLGIKTERMEELMEELYPDGEVHTELFGRKMADENTKVVTVTCVLIGKPKENEELFCDSYYHPYAGLLTADAFDGGGYIVNAHDVSKDMIDTITKNLEEIKERGEKYI